MNTTVRIKASQIYKDWHVIDAAGRPLGRVATEAAILLRGKHKPTYEPHLDDGDFVVVINAAQVRVSGNKAAQRKYYTHSGYPGGLKTRSYEEQLARFPERILEKAIWGMLPGGPLGKAIFRHLKVYKGSNHPHQSQITGSQRAAEARAAEPIAPAVKPARLRPLSVPQVAPEPVAKAVVEKKPAAPAPKPAARKARAPKTAPAATAAAELAVQDEVILTSETPPPTGVAVAQDEVVLTAETAPVEAIATPEPVAEKKPRAPRKKAEASAEAATEAAPAEKKPARRRAPRKEE